MNRPILIDRNRYVEAIFPDERIHEGIYAEATFEFDSHPIEFVQLKVYTHMRSIMEKYQKSERCYEKRYDKFLAERRIFPC